MAINELAAAVVQGGGGSLPLLHRRRGEPVAKCNWHTYHEPGERKTKLDERALTSGVPVHCLGHIKMLEPDTAKAVLMLRDWSVCRLCRMRHLPLVGRVLCAYRLSSESHRSCSICMDTTAGGKSLACAGCDSLRITSASHKDHKAQLLMLLLEPLRVTLLYVSPAVTLTILGSERRTHGHSANPRDGRQEKRFDLVVKARSGALRYVVGLEVVLSADVDAESLEYKYKWLCDEEKTTTDARRAMLVVYITKNKSDVELVLMRQWLNVLLVEGDRMFPRDGPDVGKMRVLTLGSMGSSPTWAADRWNALAAGARLTDKLKLLHYPAMSAPRHMHHGWKYSVMPFELNVLRKIYPEVADGVYEV